MMVNLNEFWSLIIQNAPGFIVGFIGGLWGPYFKRIWIEPLFDIHSLRQDIVTTLHSTARVTYNMKTYGTSESDEVAQRFSELSNRSEVIIRTFPLLNLYSRLKNIPNKDDMSKASGLFNRIVMRLRGPENPEINAGFDNYQDIKQIEELWNIKPI